MSYRCDKCNERLWEGERCSLCYPAESHIAELERVVKEQSERVRELEYALKVAQSYVAWNQGGSGGRDRGGKVMGSSETLRIIDAALPPRQEGESNETVSLGVLSTAQAEHVHRWCKFQAQLVCEDCGHEEPPYPEPDLKRRGYSGSSATQVCANCQGTGSNIGCRVCSKLSSNGEKV